MTFQRFVSLADDHLWPPEQRGFGKLVLPSEYLVWNDAGEEVIDVLDYTPDAAVSNAYNVALLVKRDWFKQVYKVIAGLSHQDLVVGEQERQKKAAEILQRVV